MNTFAAWRSLNRDQKNAFLAAFLGWALDAFDYFLVVFVISDVAKEFKATEYAVSLAVFLTLAFRPVGALIFGALGDRFGRRVPLMIDIILYSFLELITGFAPNMTAFLVIRALFGIGMGGEWGLGSALALESLPSNLRGMFSGLLQEGYAFGYLMASVVYGIAFPYVGLAGPVRDRCGAGAGVALHPCQGEGIAGLVGGHQEGAERLSRQGHRGELETVRLYGPADDGVQLHVARHAGSLPALSQKAASFRPAH